MTAGGLLHSGIGGSKVVRTSPPRIAAYCALPRHVAPRHPPPAVLRPLPLTAPPCHTSQPGLFSQLALVSQKTIAVATRPVTGATSRERQVVKTLLILSCRKLYRHGTLLTDAVAPSGEPPLAGRANPGASVFLWLSDAVCLRPSSLGNVPTGNNGASGDAPLDRWRVEWSRCCAQPGPEGLGSRSPWTGKRRKSAVSTLRSGVMDRSPQATP